MKAGATGAGKDIALSEVIGFVLLLGVFVAAMAVWMVYIVPVEGREAEISQMGSVKDTFTNYKMSLDSLWINSNNPSVATMSGVTLSTSMNLGTGGSNTQAGGVFVPLLKPVGSPAVLSLVDTGDYLMINSSGGSTDINIRYPIKKIIYTSQNYYWIQQQYYYQTGGVFLSQYDGSTCRVAPPISIVNNTATVLTNSVTVAPITLDGGANISGNGPVRIDSRLKTIQSAIGPDKKSRVNITVGVSDYATAQMWKYTFISALINGGMTNSSWYKVDTTLPGATQHSAFVMIEGPRNDAEPDVWLTLHPADYAVTFNSIASGIT